ncbi:hypothetical protein PHYSODRAFT_491991 [Phytophthora sojae]|uniref:Uncharacterized protein n=1 Tax=Phytophthora sojae (strain P6497) TaxID=1094619 RepID=G4ZAA8_PHYSP|nr:hypothetical protein PHYSODRAFT_491991 [Phytophthora sojae]EGZ21993.1 hypothetical protein PHYSODRAFT_491991 [Phytophthora sojae]|eukprot:XP_009524710.1 hypothetical protein PHYSODRAFT_491991 [Phytophthora sojae]
MEERRLRCSSATCVNLSVPTGRKKPQCSKVWKVWQCSQFHTWQIMATVVPHAHGDACCEGKHRAIITPAMKKYIGDMDETGLAPRHI